MQKKVEDENADQSYGRETWNGGREAKMKIFLKPQRGDVGRQKDCKEGGGRESGCQEGWVGDGTHLLSISAKLVLFLDPLLFLQGQDHALVLGRRNTLNDWVRFRPSTELRVAANYLFCCTLFDVADTTNL